MSVPWGFQIGPVVVEVEGEGPRGHFESFAPAGTPTLRLRAEPFDVLPEPPGDEVLSDETWSIWVAPECTSFIIHDRACVEIGATGRTGTLKYRRGLTDNPLRWRPLEELLVLHATARQGGILLHAGAVADEKSGHVLFGPSGAGKTTLTRAASVLPGAYILSDERLLVRPVGGGGWVVDGTPWPGEGKFCTNRTAALRGLLHLEKSDRDELVPMSPARALGRLYGCHFPPRWLPDGERLALDSLAQLVAEVPAFSLHNRLGGRAPELVLRSLSA